MKNMITWFVRRNNDKYSTDVEAMKLGASKKTHFQLLALLEQNPNTTVKLIVDNELEIRKRIQQMSDSLFVGTVPTLLGVTLGFFLGLASQNLFS